LAADPLCLAGKKREGNVFKGRECVGREKKKTSSYNLQGGKGGKKRESFSSPKSGRESRGARRKKGDPFHASAGEKGQVLSFVLWKGGGGPLILFYFLFLSCLAL